MRASRTFIWWCNPDDCCTGWQSSAPNHEFARGRVRRKLTRQSKENLPMIRKRRLKYVPAALFAVVIAATAINGCSAAKDLEGASQGCDGLDVNVQAQLTVKSFTDAAVTLKARAKDVEARFLAVCNKMN